MYYLLALAYQCIAWHIPPLMHFSTIGSMSILDIPPILILVSRKVCRIILRKGFEYISDSFHVFVASICNVFHSQISVRSFVWHSRFTGSLPTIHVLESSNNFTFVIVEFFKRLSATSDLDINFILSMNFILYVAVLQHLFSFLICSSC